MGQDTNRHAMAKGLIMGALIAINYILSTFEATSFLSFGVEIIILFFVYKATVDCRENVLDGVISYGRAWWYVVNLFLYSSMVGGVIKYFYLRVIRPEYLDGLIPQVKEIMGQMSLSNGEMKEVMGSIQEVLTPANVALYSIMGDVLLGVLIGLIIAAIVKRDETYRHTEEE